jgi:SM-20-related protein
MPGPEFFRQAGFFVLPGFLEPESILHLRHEMASAPREKALVVKPGGIECLDEGVRKVEASVLPKEMMAQLKERLRGLVPALEKHFHVQIADCESPQYLIYRPGDFFTPHSDGGRPGQTEYTQHRRVSAVIFLNRESDEPAEETYGAGRLTFYGILDGPMWERCAFPLKPEPGLLIAFPSEKIHEVTPVSHGLRFTVVTWFYAAEPKQAQLATELGEPANSEPVMAG